MEPLLHSSLTSTLLLVAAAVAGVSVLYYILKGVLRIVLLVVILFIIYAGYLHYTGRKVPVTRDEIVRQGSEVYDSVRDRGLKALEDSLIKEKQGAKQGDPVR
jgi:hypothetical protein